MLVFILLSSIASATDLSYIDAGDYILFDRGDGSYINLTGQQNFSEFNFTAPILNITINSSYSTYNNTANITISSISYSNDKLNFTGIATSGTLNISAKMSNISTYYHLFIDNLKNTSIISDIIGVVNYVWSSWSSHFFSIQENVAPSIGNVTNQNVNEGQVVFVDIDGSDANGDPLTFSTNRSDLFTDFNTTTGKGNWTTNFSSAGTHYVNFGVSDGITNTNETMTITITNIPLSITAFQPSSDPSVSQNTAQVFNITLNHSANVTWLVNGTQAHVNTSVTIANYTNNGSTAGNFNITASVTDGVDTVSRMWNLTVTATSQESTSTTTASTSKSSGNSFIPYIPTTTSTTSTTTSIPTSTSPELYEQFIPTSSPYQVQKPLDIGIYSIQFSPSCASPLFLNRINNNISIISQCTFDKLLINFIVPKNMEVFQLVNGSWLKSEQQIVAKTTDDKYYIIQVSPKTVGIFTFTEKSLVTTIQEKSIKDIMLYIDSVLYEKVTLLAQMISDPNTLKDMDKSIYKKLQNTIIDIKSIDDMLFNKLLNNIEEIKPLVVS